MERITLTDIVDVFKPDLSDNAMAGSLSGVPSDWRTYLPIGIIAEWSYLSERERKIVFLVANAQTANRS